MRNIKVILIVVLGFGMLNFFNACGEISFSNATLGLEKISVSEENIDTPQEVEMIDDVFGVQEGEMPEAEEAAEEEHESMEEELSIVVEEESSSESQEEEEETQVAEESEHRQMNSKVVICHIPKGKSSKGITLSVSWSAVRAHVEENHHRGEGEAADYFGPCEE